MKPRARRITLGAALAGVGVLALILALNWGTVRNHVEAWHFQLTRETETIESTEPSSLMAHGTIGVSWMDPCTGRSRFSLSIAPWGSDVLPPKIQLLSDRPLVIALKEFNAWSVWPEKVTLTEPDSLYPLDPNKSRVLEQRFPRRAYVVIRDHGAAR